jgi:outer membrane protein assembly factor BamB
MGCGRAKRDLRAPINAVFSWNIPLSPAGLSGSPTLRDLDHDGKLEAIVPVSIQVPHEGWILVADAATGATRWEARLKATVFPCPYCVDVDEDGTDDVIVAKMTGDSMRVLSSDLLALSGRDGHRLWSINERNPGLLRAGNVYTTVAESSESRVMFVTVGGDQSEEKDPTIPRVPGRLVAFDRQGKVVARWSEPHAAEIYTSPAVARTGGELLVVVGSGGETLAGRLYVLAFHEGSRRFEQRAVVASSCAAGGFDSSPVLGDVTGDGVPEVIANDYCGTVFAVSVRGETLWTAKSEIAPGLANPLLVDLDGDRVFDVVASFSTFDPAHEKETAPTAESDVLAFAGKTGRPLWRRHVEAIITASPCSADVDGDGREDVLVVAWRGPAWRGRGPGTAGGGELLWLSGRSGEVLFRLNTANMWGTPILADFDGNGALDVLVTDFRNNHGSLVRLEFPSCPYVPAASWSGYRGYPVQSGYRR